MFSGSIIFYIIFLFLFLDILRGNIPPIIAALITNPPLGLSFLAGLVIGITIHEASHAFVAYRLGDPTAKLEGRLTLNPQSHIDPVGALMLLLLGFGWGKPTPFDPFNLKNIKRDSALISAAGATANFLIAIVFSLPYLIFYYTGMLNPTIASIYLYLSPFIWINLILGVFNLIPISPLDGFKVLAGLLPREWYEDFIQMKKYGIFILLALVFTGVIGKILLPITSTIFGFLIPSLNAPF